MKRLALACMALGVLSACDRDFRLFRHLGDEKQSQCGGFVVPGQAEVEVASPCVPEKLLWEYNAWTRTVTFIHRNIRSSCDMLIDSAVKHDEESGYWVITETYTGGQAGCFCNFDIWNSFTVAKPGKIEFRLLTHDGSMYDFPADLRFGRGEKMLSDCE